MRLPLLAHHGYDILYIVVGSRAPASATTLTPAQAALIESYNKADEEGQAAARKVLASLVK